MVAQSSAFDAFAAHGSNGGGLAAGEIGLDIVAGKLRRFLRLLSGLIADTQTHQQLAKLEPGNEAIRRLLSRLAQLLERFVHLKVNAQCHAIKDANLGNMRFQFDCIAKLRDDAGTLFRFQHARISKHALQQTASFWADRRGQRKRSRRCRSQEHRPGRPHVDLSSFLHARTPKT